VRTERTQRLADTNSALTKAETLRAVAPLADARNIAGGEPVEIKHKLDVLRRHCDEVGRDYDTIEKTHVRAWLLARNDAEVAAKRERLPAREPSYGFVVRCPRPST
jgi:hypothetical protein